jgi:hypothetical protein
MPPIQNLSKPIQRIAHADYVRRHLSQQYFTCSVFLSFLAPGETEFTNRDIPFAANPSFPYHPIEILLWLITCYLEHLKHDISGFAEYKCCTPTPNDTFFSIF